MRKQRSARFLLRFWAINALFCFFLRFFAKSVDKALDLPIIKNGFDIW
jgi:hypothetical protein